MITWGCPRSVGVHLQDFNACEDISWSGLRISSKQCPQASGAFCRGAVDCQNNKFTSGLANHYSSGHASRFCDKSRVRERISCLKTAPFPNSPRSLVPSDTLSLCARGLIGLGAYPINHCKVYIYIYTFVMIFVVPQPWVKSQRFQRRLENDIFLIQE